MWRCCKYAPLSACQFGVSINVPKFYAKLVTENIKTGLQTNSKGTLLANACRFPFWTHRHLSSCSFMSPCAALLAPQVPRPAPRAGVRSVASQAHRAPLLRHAAHKRAPTAAEKDWATRLGFAHTCSLKHSPRQCYLHQQNCTVFYTRRE